jgi:hypothetical protein
MGTMKDLLKFKCRLVLYEKDLSMPLRLKRVALCGSRGVSTIPLTKLFFGAPHNLLACFTMENSPPSHLGGGNL